MKRLTLLILFILILAACNSPQESSQKENEQEEPEQTEEAANEEVAEDEEADKEEASEEEAAPVENEGETVTEEEKQDTSIESNDEKDADKHQEIVDLAYEIFEAQNDKDYEFLQSVISKGTKLDEKNNKFIFENVTYPHEQEFFTDEDLGELEFRYTHEENANSVIVGFGAIDYANESSFVIDFEFIKEDGKWKMNDMDINK